MKRPLTWIVCLVCQVAVARGEYFQGPYGAGGSWNVYEFVAEPTDWRSAAAAASERSYGSVAGQLVDILSAQENSLIEWIGNGEPVWIGLTDREGAAPATISGGLPAPQESRTLPDRTAQGWAWTSGSLFQYQNWDVDEPRDYRGAEDAAHLLPNGRWNDIASGYRADEPAPPLLQPNTSSDELSAFRAPFVIEYALQSASPVPGVLVPTIPAKMPPQLPGAPGGAGTLRVTDYRGDFQVGKRIEDVASLVTAIATGAETAESWSALYPRADVADPDSRSGGGPTVDGTRIPFPRRSHSRSIRTSSASLTAPFTFRKRDFTRFKYRAARALLCKSATPNSQGSVATGKLTRTTRERSITPTRPGIPAPGASSP